MPDYEITIAGRMGPVVASCPPGLRTVAPPATVLHALARDREVVLQLRDGPCRSPGNRSYNSSQGRDSITPTTGGPTTISPRVPVSEAQRLTHP